MVKTIEYRGRYIDYNFYGNSEWSVQYNGDDIIFATEADAEAFIDTVIWDDSMIEGGEEK